MTQNQPIQLVVSPQFQAAVPAEMRQSPREAEMAVLAPVEGRSDRLICQSLLMGETRRRAEREAREVWSKIQANTQVLATFGTATLDGVNQLNDRMLSERPPVDIPELNEAMRQLSRRMRGVGKKYDPSDPKVRERYQKVKGGFLSIFRRGKSFLEEFLDDVRSLQQQFEVVVRTLEGKQFILLKNVAYYDQFYRLNEQEIDKLIYVIGVMEIIRDLAVEQANQIHIGDSNVGDRGSEEQARILELVTLLDNKIIAFKGRLWVAWAMAPQIRAMRVISLGVSARIDQTVGITIPTMKNTIVVWLTLSDSDKAMQFNEAVDDTYNETMVGFARAAKAIIPAVASSLATPAMKPQTLTVWGESFAAQADSYIQAVEEGQQKQLELEAAMMASKNVIDASTQRVNEALLRRVLASVQNAPLEIAKSMPGEN